MPGSIFSLIKLSSVFCNEAQFIYSVITFVRSGGAKLQQGKRDPDTNVYDKCVVHCIENVCSPLAIFFASKMLLQIHSSIFSVGRLLGLFLRVTWI